MVITLTVYEILKEMSFLLMNLGTVTLTMYSFPLNLGPFFYTTKTEKHFPQLNNMVNNER